MMKNLEKKIVERIHEFDVISLLRLLYSMDYSPDTVSFRSNDRAGGSVLSAPGGSACGVSRLRLAIFYWEMRV